MKIAVCGKGGSGKSVVVTLLADQFRARGYRVLVVDSDESNSGLFRMLGFERPPVPLIELVGGKKDLQQKMKTPSSTGSAGNTDVLRQQRIFVKDIPADYMLHSDNLYLVNVGKILQALEGCACPMGVLSREFLAKLELEAKEVTIVDMEAGVEHFGRGIETNIDKVLAVVEPSLESVELAARIRELAGGAGVANTYAVLNKIPSEQVGHSLEEALHKRGLQVIGSIGYDPKVSEACLEGGSPSGGSAYRDLGPVAERLLEAQSRKT